jgi:glycosyltransferase involved in cell wall biosynthesis
MRAKMKILFVADVSIKKVIGGAERVLYEQSCRLAEKGHEVFIITRKLPSHISSHEFINHVHEFRYGIIKFNFITFILSSILNSIRLFSRLAEVNSFDIINFHQPFSALGINLASKNKKIKKVYSCHSLDFEEFLSRNPKPSQLLPRIGYTINSVMRKLNERFNISKSDIVIVASDYVKNKLVEYHKINPKKIYIRPYGVDLKKFKFNEDKHAARRELGLPKDRFILFTVRNLVPRMGLENLIYAMKVVIKSMKNIYLIIGGEGELKTKLQDLISESNLTNFVKLQGFIPEEELPLYHQAADFFILPTRCLEGFGLVTVESLACGTPVLGTPVGGTKEILGKFNPSFLFKDIRPESMAALILDKYNYYKARPDEYKKLSHGCREFVEKNYSWGKNTDEIQALFSGLIDSE